ncbi:involucrin-like [Molothrus aeneus]|uniref:involucrin-like n=1 Tax=Molothrus aeneus TaxID=84833 RepID=UPI00345817FD
MLQTVCMSPELLVNQNMSESEICGYSPGQGSPLPGETASPKSCFQQSPSLPDSGLTELNVASPKIYHPPPPPPCNPPGMPAPADSELSSDPPQKRYMGVRVKMPVRELLRKIRLSKGLDPAPGKEASAVKMVAKGSSGKTAEKRRSHPYTEKQLRQSKQSAGQSPRGLEDLDILVEVLQEDLNQSQLGEEPQRPVPDGLWQGFSRELQSCRWQSGEAHGGLQGPAELHPRSSGRDFHPILRGQAEPARHGQQESTQRSGSPGIFSRTGGNGGGWWVQDGPLSCQEGFTRGSAPRECLLRNSPSQGCLLRNSAPQGCFLKSSPSQECFLRSSPSQECLLRSSPSQEGFLRNSPAQEGFMRNSPSQECLLRNSPSQECLLRNSPSQEGFMRDSPSQECLLRNSPCQEGFLRNSPSQECLLRNSAPQGCFLKSSPSQECLLRDSPSQECLLRDSPSQECLLRNPQSQEGFLRDHPPQKGFLKNSPSQECLLRNSSSHKGFPRNFSPQECLLRNSAPQDTPAVPSLAEMLLEAPRGSPDVEGHLRPTPNSFTRQDLSALSFFQFQLRREENLLRNIPEEELLAPDENGNRLLHKAVAQGRRALTFALARRFASLNKIDEKDAEKRTALHLAAEKNQHLMVSDLISLGANVNEQDSSGKTPLHLCAENGYLRVLQVLKSCKSNGVCVEVDLPDHHGLTPLHCAALAHTVLVTEPQGSARDSSAGRFLRLRRAQILEGILCLLQMGAEPQLQVLHSCPTSTPCLKLEENTELMCLLQTHKAQAQDVPQESCSLLDAPRGIPAPPAADNSPGLGSLSSSDLLDVLLQGKC